MFRFMPRRPGMEAFSEEVMKSWRAAGGQPNVAIEFPSLFREAGMAIVEAHPRILRVSPRSHVWQWPASFIEINLVRLLEIGRVTKGFERLRAFEVIKAFRSSSPSRASA